MVNPNPNPWGNHCGTKHKVGKLTGGANRGQGRISNIERLQREAENRNRQQQHAEAQRIAREKEKQKAAKQHQEIQKKYEDYCKVAAKIYESEGLDNSRDDDFLSDDEDDDHGKEYGSDDEEEPDELPTTVNQKAAKKAFRYMPQKNSCIWQLMNDHEMDMKSAFRRKGSKLWYWGSDDPIAMNSHSAQKWYTSQFNVFNWLVFDVFNIDIKNIKCIHGCKGTGMQERQAVKLHSYCWSPMICMDHRAWVYHQRLICNCCKKTFTTINPAFMSQIPTRVVERFPFFTTRRGAGIHEALVFQFISLVGTGVIFGSYVKSINELQQIKYAQDQVNYYDSIAEALENFDPNAMPFAPQVCVLPFITQNMNIDSDSQIILAI